MRLRCFARVMGCVQRMRVRGVCVMGGFLMGAGGIMRGGFLMMLHRMLVMLGRFGMMLARRMMRCAAGWWLGHIYLPVFEILLRSAGQEAGQAAVRPEYKGLFPEIVPFKDGQRCAKPF